MQQENVFLLDTCFWLISAIIIYLTYPIIYPIMWAMNRELESVALNFKRLLRQHLNNLPIHKCRMIDSLDVGGLLPTELEIK